MSSPSGDIKERGTTGRADQHGEWWGINAYSYGVSHEPSDSRMLFSATTATLEMSAVAIGLVESSSVKILPIGLALKAATPLVAVFAMKPGPEIKFDNVKGKLTTTSARISKLGITLATAQEKAVMAELSAILQDVSRAAVQISNGGVQVGLAQQTRA